MSYRGKIYLSVGLSVLGTVAVLAFVYAAIIYGPNLLAAVIAVLAVLAVFAVILDVISSLILGW